VRRRTITVIAATAAFTVLMAGAALAVEQTNGQGLTHNGSSLGFNAKLDLTGEITYTTHDGTMWQVHCAEITSYRNLKPDAQGGLRTKVTAACEDKDGNPVWAEFYFTDRGEPGKYDIVRAFFTYDSTYALDANGDPDVWLLQCNSGTAPTEGCMDSGRITKGNVQIHQSADSMDTVIKN
jgi:hypothetical protein